VSAAERQWLSGALARKRLEVSKAVLAKIVESGAVRYRELPGGQGRQYSRADVDRYAESCVVSAATAPSAS
jgi:hypothetical protein